MKYLKVMELTIYIYIYYNIYILPSFGQVDSSATAFFLADNHTTMMWSFGDVRKRQAQQKCLTSVGKPVVRPHK